MSVNDLQAGGNVAIAGAGGQVSQVTYNLVLNHFTVFGRHSSRDTIVSPPAHDEPEVQPTAEAKAEVRDGILKAFDAASASLLSWPTTLNDGTRLENAQVLAFKRDFAAGDRPATILLLGEPGSGKSALLATVGKERRAVGAPVLAIKADTLPVSVDSARKLGEFLRLPAEPLRCVEFLAQTGKVYVLVDQLDALGDLVDLRSERLNVLLQLIRDLSGLDNVHVLASCRVFEHQHDSRLTSIEATMTFKLEPPAWEEVAAVLRQKGIEAGDWPSATRELLRIPQQLKVFLSVLPGTTHPQLLASYQRVLEELWRQKVLGGEEGAQRSVLLDEIASTMAEEETLWISPARYEARHRLVEELVAGDLLMYSQDGTSISFRHQTVFTHARARAFARGNRSLAGYVVERQQALFVRPTLWSSLVYLRGAERPTYYREFEALWSNPALRVHVRLLLIEFLGQLEDPEEREQRWLLRCLDKDELLGKCLAATVGRRRWFELLAAGYLPMYMARERTDAAIWQIIRVLGAGWEFDRQAVLELLNAQWLPFAERDPDTWRVMESLAGWDEQTVNLACSLVTRTGLPDVRVVNVAASISASAPALAPRLIVAALERKLGQALEEDSRNPPAPPPTDGAPAAEVYEWALHRTEPNVHRVLTLSTGWSELPGIAEAAPREYLEALWPWFVRVLNLVLHQEDRLRHWYRYDAALTGYGHSTTRPVVEAFDAAVIALAETRPQEFLSFYQRWKDVDSMAVQCMLAHGFERLAASQPDVVLEFLLENPRRFGLGNYRDHDRETTWLISVLVPHLDPDGKKRLENAIMQWTGYKDALQQESPEEQAQHARWLRENHIRLLSAFPADSLSAERQSFLAQEKQELPHALDPGMTEGGTITSPMPTAQMAAAGDEEVVALFAELADENSSRNRRRSFLEGGTHEASHSLADLAKRDPDRVIGLLHRFDPEQGEQPVAAVVGVLGETNYPPAKIGELFLDLDRKGFRGSWFRSGATSTLNRLLENGHGLSDDLCALLERWLKESREEMATKPAAATPDGVATGSDEPRRQSVLWQTGGLSASPSRAYSFLDALGNAYRARRPPEYGRWLQVLEDHLDGNEQAETWKVVGWKLSLLVHADHARAEDFVRRLFEKYPAVHRSPIGARLVAQVRGWVSPERLRGWVEGMREAGWVDGDQAYGEVIFLLACLDPQKYPWAAERTNAFLQGASPDTAGDAKVRLGMAYAAAHLWSHAPSRKKSTEALLALVPDTDSPIAHPFGEIFRVTQRLLPDHETFQLIGTFCRNPVLLKATEAGFLMDRLHDLLPSHPELILQVVEAVLGVSGEDMRDLRTAWAGYTRQIVDLTLTLQRFDDPIRSKGLELFERLLLLDIPETTDTLSDLDVRPVGSVRAVVRRPARARSRRRGGPPPSDA